MRLRRLRTDDLTPAEVVEIRRLLDAAFGDDEEERFTEADWDHSVGGVHFVLDDEGQIVSHASVVERELHLAGQPFRTGYVEAVATRPDRQGEGFGTTVMRDATAYVRETFELGALGTGEQGFYERLGWTIWAGPSSVRTDDGRATNPRRGRLHHGPADARLGRRRPGRRDQL